MSMIMANNLEIKLSTFGSYNLSLASFMEVSLMYILYVVDILLRYFKVFEAFVINIRLTSWIKLRNFFT